MAAVIGFAFISFVEILRKLHPRFNKAYIDQAGVLMRDHELHSLSTAFYFLLGVLLSVALYPRAISDLLILYVAFGDPMASITGISISSPKLIGRKSLAGVCGCAATCFLITALYYHGANLPRSLLCAIIAAAAELIELPGVDDNFSMQLLAGPLLYVTLA